MLSILATQPCKLLSTLSLTAVLLVLTGSLGTTVRGHCSLLVPWTPHTGLVWAQVPLSQTSQGVRNPGQKGKDKDGDSGTTGPVGSLA